MLSFNSYGETLVCSYLLNDEIRTLQYKRQGDVFIESEYGSKNQIYYEDDDTLALHSNFKGTAYMMFLRKESNEFSQHLIGVKLDFRDTGKCEVIY
jgi:hypothetical protein